MTFWPGLFIGYLMGAVSMLVAVILGHVLSEGEKHQ